MLTLVQFFFTINTGFSGQKFYPEAGIQNYNTLFTAFPIILYAVFDRDLSYEDCLKYPKLFKDCEFKEVYVLLTVFGDIALLSM